MKKSICIISYSFISKDARVLRQIRYLSKAYSLTIIGYGKPHPDFSDNNNIKWIEIPRSKRSLKRRLADFIRIIKYFLGLPDRKKVLEAAINTRADYYHSNNWETLPVAVKAAKINNSKLILDIHESLLIEGGYLYNMLNKLIVHRYKGCISGSTTVVEAIAEDYQKTFGFKPQIVRNIPEPPSIPIKFHSSKPKKIKLVHHGGAVPSRKPEIMIKALAMSRPNYELHLVFTNLQSSYSKNLRILAENIAPGRVFFYPAYDPRLIVKEIAKFDIGFYPLPPTVYNNLIALPNKVFEFIAAGLALCIGPSPSMAKIVREYNCGKVSRSFEPKDLAEILNITNHLQWDEMKKASIMASKELNADNEMRILLDLYKRL